MLIHGHRIEHDVFEQTQVCIVGSGAGGAPMAKELAEQGVDVVLLEEGAYFDETDFSGVPAEMLLKLYRDAGSTTALGRPAIPVPLGCCVGGTTVVNSGTCFRTPDSVLEAWNRKLGLGSISPAALQPYFERVEALLEVAPVDPGLAGRNAALVRRGAEALGLNGGFLKRNAPGCRGSGVCAFGCPTGAKLAMHRSYLPLASRAGARIYAGCRAERILTLGGAAAGVEALFLEAGSHRPRARLGVGCSVLVLCAGAVHTPLLLARNRLGRDLPGLGRNLSLHPATKVVGLFERSSRGAEPVDPWVGVPQSYFVDDFQGEGLLFETISTPPDAGAMGISAFGAEHQAWMESYRDTATLGVMVADSSKGRVLGWRGRPLLLYQVNREDTRKLVRGLATAAEILFAAGALKVHLPVAGHEILDRPGDVDAFLRSRVAASQVDLAAFHPMGTCAMGTDPRNAVLKDNGELYGVDNLFVADASIFPTSLGVNPQISIMAFSTRIAEEVLARIRP